MKTATHPDLEYAVQAGGVSRHFSKFGEALFYAFSTALDEGSVVIDVLAFSEAGADAFGGADAVQQYREDPDATVFRRFELAVGDVGRVP
jgi:hypothetical protein